MFSDIREFVAMQSSASCTTIAPSDSGRIAAGTLDVNSNRRSHRRLSPIPNPSFRDRDGDRVVAE